MEDNPELNVGWPESSFVASDLVDEETRVKS